MCGDDTHIAPAKRAAIDLAAVNFVNALFSSNPSDAFDALSKDGQLAITREKVATMGRDFLPLSPKNVAVQHSYEVSSVGKPSGPAVCGDDFSKPEKIVLLTQLDAPDQAAVLMSADAINNHLAISVSLVPEQGAWKVRGFWVNVSTLAEYDSNQLWQLGRAQQEKGHDFNATLLLSASLQLAKRGPDLKLGIVQYIQEDLSNLSAPIEIRGQPPLIWNKGAKDFKILSCGPVAVGGKIYVNLVQEVEPWKDDAQVVARNKELIAYFKQRFPEYSEVFAGIVVRASERGTHRGYGTVDENSKQ
jgi:hypothetical protein